MYNVFLLSGCNLHCAYCFAEEYRSAIPERKRGKGSAGEAMTADTFSRILDFLSKSQVPIVSLIGGEPTLHPEFSAFVKIALERNLSVSVKSNVAWNENILREIQALPDDGVHFLLNINNPKALGASLWRRVAENARRMRGKDVDFQLNINGPDFEYGDFLGLAGEVRPKRIVWSLSGMVKGMGRDSLSDPFAVREKYSRRILAFLTEAGRAGIPTMGVHGITPCMFSAEDYRALLSYGGKLESTCQPVFDFLPDLSVLFCFPMEKYSSRKSLDRYRNLQEMNMEFMEDLAFLRSDSYPLEECVDCSFSRSQTCHGGCLARNLDRRKDLPTDDGRFLDRIPFPTGNFRLEENAADGALLVNIESGERYPIDRSLASLLKVADGNASLRAMYRTAFPRSNGNEITRWAFREVVIQLLRRGVLGLKPFRKAGTPASRHPSTL
jgi:radical SAM protein with 4Fe4S-binding SPASM domain